MAYRTVKQNSEVEHIVKRSRFIGRCFPVSSEQEALALLEKLRKQHWDATHNCYAYAIGEVGGVARYSDDGEPSGTAGLPMLEAMRRIGVTDTLVVVTRYFGGILLGTGGLVRAYTSATVAAIERAGRVEMRSCVEIRVRIPYNLWGKLELILREMTQIEDVQYSDQIDVTAWVFSEEADAFSKRFVDRSNGVVSPMIGKTMVRAFPVVDSNDIIHEFDEE